MVLSGGTTHFTSFLPSKPPLLLLLAPRYTRQHTFSFWQPARHGRLHASLTDHSERSTCPDGACLYLKRSIESGEVIHYPGTVIVFGDVNPGGTVVADRDIIILGQLFGKAHAGRGGNLNSTILALRMEPCGLLIINNVELVLEGNVHYGPEIVSMASDGTIRKKVLQTGIKLSTNNTLHESKYAIQPAKIALITGAYISIVGIAVLLFPISIFGFFFDLQTLSPGWIQVLATLAVVFGIYYVGTAVGDIQGKHGSYSFYMSTVVGRLFLFASFCWIVVRQAMPSTLFFVGAINLLGALLMLRALQQSKKC